MIEIEKKYRLTKQKQIAVRERLSQIGARYRGEEFEENTLYSSETIDLNHSVLRLRRAGKTATLTYKERFPSTSAIKHQREDETIVADAEAMDAILDGLGFTPILVYEKRRQTWMLGKAEIVLDELPFGFFMEIEGEENEIREAEKKLAIKGLRTERQTYPDLTRKHGRRFGDLIESRFEVNG